MAKILIVDDDESFVEGLKDVLGEQGFAIVCAYNGEEGLRKAREEKPDLVLLDVMMTTDSEGFEVAKKLREDPVTQKVPVILLTGVRKAKQLPFSYEPDEDWLPVMAVLEKPVHPEDLIRQIRQTLKA
jgi:two-component system alkaline phosphatase synthesis response regulator PhoP